GGTPPTTGRQWYRTFANAAGRRARAQPYGMSGRDTRTPGSGMLNGWPSGHSISWVGAPTSVALLSVKAHSLPARRSGSASVRSPRALARQTHGREDRSGRAPRALSSGQAVRTGSAFECPGSPPSIALWSSFATQWRRTPQPPIRGFHPAGPNWPDVVGSTERG